MSGDRLALAPRVAVEEDAERALADPRDALGLELVADRGQLGVVARLAVEVGVGQRDAHHVVDPVEVVLRQLDDLAPEAHGVGVAGLERDDPGPGPRGERGVAVEVRAGRLVEGVRVGLEQRGLGRVLADVEEVLDEHAERRAPVADVVLPDHVVPQSFERAGSARRRPPWCAGARRASPWRRWARSSRSGCARVGCRGTPRPGSAAISCERSGEPLVGEGDVDEPGSADLDLLGDPLEVEVAQTSAVATSRGGIPSRLARASGALDLEVGELRRPQHRVGLAQVRVLAAERRGDGRGDTGSEDLGRGRHGHKARGEVPVRRIPGLRSTEDTVVLSDPCTARLTRR